MPKFQFNVNQQVKIWEKTPVEIEADNQKMAMMKLKEMLKENQDIYRFACGKSELIQGTKENLISKEDNAAKISFCKPVKQEFEFTVDEKISIWIRSEIYIPAYSYEEAEKILIDSVKEDPNKIYDMASNSAEYIYETEETITPEENGGCATLEIYKGNDTTQENLIYSNEEE